MQKDAKNIAGRLMGKFGRKFLGMLVMKGSRFMHLFVHLEVLESLQNRVHVFMEDIKS